MKDIRKLYERKAKTMTEIITWAQTYDKEILTGAFFAVQGLFLILLLMNGHRIKKIRRKMNQITEQAEEVLKNIQKDKEVAHVTAVKSEPEQIHIEESHMEEKMRERIRDAKEQKERMKTEEKESGLISAVLREIFP